MPKKIIVQGRNRPQIIVAVVLHIMEYEFIACGGMEEPRGSSPEIKDWQTISHIQTCLGVFLLLFAAQQQIVHPMINNTTAMMIHVAT